MPAHQIIYTSCRRGIEGTSDGLQVFSYDENIRNEQVDMGQGFSRLFVDPDPREVDVSAFGCHEFDRDYLLFTYNTKLRYDYRGPEGRGGNVLRQSVLVPKSEVWFRPIEWYGSDVFVSRLGPEVASEERPRYLDEVIPRPSQLLSQEAIADWLTQGDRLDLLPDLIAMVVHAKSRGRFLVILDSPHNVAHWLAAVEYALPRRLCRQLSFLLHCDQPGMAGGDVTGATLSAFDETPSYAKANCDVFDPLIDFDTDVYDVAGGYAGLVTLAFGMLPQRLVDFADFVGDHTDVGFCLESIELAHTVWRMLDAHMKLPTVQVLSDVLPFTEVHADEQTNEKLCKVLLGALDEVERRGIDALVVALGFLLRNMGKLDKDDASRVGMVATATVSRLLSDSEVSPDMFPARYLELTDSCATGGMDLTALLREGGYSETMFAEGEVSDPLKIREFCRIVADYARLRGVPADEFGPSAPYGSLIGHALERAYSFGPNEGNASVLALVQCFRGSFEHQRAFANVGLDMLKAVWPQSPSAGLELCESVVGCMEYGQPAEIADMMAWSCSRGMIAKVLQIGVDAMRLLSTSREVAGLYRAVLTGPLAQDKRFISNVYPGFCEAYVSELAARDDQDATIALKALQKSIMDASERPGFNALPYEAILPAMADVLLRHEDVRNPSEGVRFAIKKYLKYERMHGRKVIKGRMALAYALDLLRHSSDDQDCQRRVMSVRAMRGRLDLRHFDAEEREQYLDALVEPLLDISCDAGILNWLVLAYNLSVEQRNALLASLTRAAAKRSRGRRGTFDSLAVVAVYAATFADDSACDTVVRYLGHVKEGDLFDLRMETERQSDPDLLRHYGVRDVRAVRRRLDNMQARMRKGGLFRIFKR